MMTNQARMEVPLLDLKAQYADIREAVREAIDEVCDSQWFVLGPKVKELEEQLAEYCNCKFAIGVSSGTDALLVALMALDVGAGDAVITTPYTFFATGGVIARLGARPIFCDVDPETYNLDPVAVRLLISDKCEQQGEYLIYIPTGERVKVLMPVHLFGQTVDMPEISAIAREHGLKVVEDAAQSIGSEYATGGRAGSEGDVGCFSFFPSKNLGAFGDGGLCATNDERLAERMRVTRVHGGKPKYYHAFVGGNFRLDAIQAAILLVKFKYLDSWTEGRQSNAAYYDQAFSAAACADKVSVPKVLTGRRHIYNQYTLRVKDRDGLRKFLHDAGIGTEIYYPVPLHLQECFTSLQYQEGDCPHSEEAAKNTLAIPVYPELTHEQLDYVVSQVSNFYA